MREIQICPHCRSTFYLNGSLEFGAKAIQVINCPVCGQEIWKDSGFWPQKWTVGEVITRNYEPTPAIIISPPPEPDKTVWGDFGSNILNTITSPFKDLSQGVYKIGIWVVIVLILVFLISRQWNK